MKQLEDAVRDSMGSEDLEVSLPSEKERPYLLDYIGALTGYLWDRFVAPVPRVAARFLLYAVGGGLSCGVKERIEERYGREFFDAERATLWNMAAKIPLYSGLLALRVSSLGYTGEPVLNAAAAGLAVGVGEGVIRLFGAAILAPSRFTPGDLILGPVSWMGEKLYNGIRGVHSDVAELTEQRRSGKG